MDERERRSRAQAKRRQMYRRARRRQRNARLVVVMVVVLIVAAIGGSFIWKRYSPSNEKADLKEYYGLTNDEDYAVVINDQVIKREDGIPSCRNIDGQVYLEYSIVRDYVNKRFYWDSNENVLLYTLPTGNVSVAVGSKDYTEIMEKKSEDYVILKTEGKTAYIAVPFIMQYTDMDYHAYEGPNRVVITNDFHEKTVADLKRETAVRYLGGVKSPILTTAKKADVVTVLEDEDDWQKVATADGFIGYVPSNALKNTQKEVVDRAFSEPQYSNISVDYTINMAWHNVTSDYANSFVLETIAGTKGLTTIEPTWFSVEVPKGNITSLVSSSYVIYAHQSPPDVWATLWDFDGGISSFDETYQLLSYTSHRERLVNQVIAQALQSGIDGVNLDFELISTECGEHYIQFVRELSVKCRQNGLVLSIDNYVPQVYNGHYDLEEQAIVADYIIIMGYDEHTAGSYEAGSVASYNYVKQGIEDALKSVPSQKLVTAVPFYTRLWFERPKTEEELAEQEGTEAAGFPMAVTSTALTMGDARSTLEIAGVSTQWDEETRQNYAQWEADGGTYKIWLEDLASLEEKLKLIRSEKLAGVAEWKLGQEDSAVWDLILQYVN